MRESALPRAISYVIRKPPVKSQAVECVDKLILGSPLWGSWSEAVRGQAPEYMFLI